MNQIRTLLIIFNTVLALMPIHAMELLPHQSIDPLSLSHINQCKILPATEHDLAELHQFWHEQWHATYQLYYSPELLKQTFTKFFNMNHLKEMLSTGARFLKVVDVDKHIIGTASGEQKENDTLFISKMYIDRFHQKTGIGSHLIQALIEQFKPKRIRVIVQEDNPSGRRFFEKLGFHYETAKAKENLYNGEKFNYFYMSKMIEA